MSELVHYSAGDQVVTLTLDSQKRPPAWRLPSRASRLAGIPPRRASSPRRDTPAPGGRPRPAGNGAD